MNELQLEYKKLRDAASEGHLEVVKYLVDDIGFEVDDMNRLLQTPVMFAAKNGHIDVVKYFADEKAKLFDKDANDYSARDHAEKNGHFEVVDFLDNTARDVKENFVQNITGDFNDLAKTMQNAINIVMKL